MNLPDGLSAHLTKLRDSVSAHRQSALVPSLRYETYSLIGQLSAGRKINGWLAVIAARRALPLWEAAYPADDGPRRLIEVAASSLSGTSELTKATETWGRYEERFSIEAVAEAVEEGTWTPWRAALAAASAFTEQQEPHPFLAYRVSQHDSDADIDPWAHDTALWAVEAEAGAIWEPDSDSSKRLSFWKWWIEEAIAEAWASAGFD